jgi:hypothetical protein
VVLLTGDRDRTWCFADQVKLTRALVSDLDEVVKEVKLLGEHEEESCQKITELEARCMSRDALITEIAKEIELDCKGEDAEAKDVDDDDGGDAAAPSVVLAQPPAPVPPAAIIPKETVVEEDPMEVVLEQEAHVAHVVILANAEPEMLQPHLYRMLMKDYEESLSRMIDGFDDLDDQTEASSDMDEWFLSDGSNDQD